MSAARTAAAAVLSAMFPLYSPPRHLWTAHSDGTHTVNYCGMLWRVADGLVYVRGGTGAWNLLPSDASVADAAAVVRGN